MIDDSPTDHPAPPPDAATSEQQAGDVSGAAEFQHPDVSNHGAPMPEANQPSAGGTERFDIPHTNVLSQSVANRDSSLESSQSLQSSLAKDWSAAHQSPPVTAVTGVTSDDVINGVQSYAGASVASSSGGEKSLAEAEATVAGTSEAVTIAAAAGDAAAVARGAIGEMEGRSGGGVPGGEGVGVQLQQAQAQLQAQLQEQLQALENVLSLLGLGVASASNSRGPAELGEEWGDGASGTANRVEGQKERARRRREDLAMARSASSDTSSAPSPFASPSGPEAEGAERKVLERAVVEMALLQEVSRGGIEGSTLEEEWGELRQAVSQDPQLSRLYNEQEDVAARVSNGHELSGRYDHPKQQHSHSSRTILMYFPSLCHLLTLSPIARAPPVHAIRWMLFGPAASAAGTVFGMAGLGFAAKTAAAAPVAVAVVPQMDALWRSFGGASLVALYWRTLVFGKTFRSIEWDLEAYDAPNGNMKSITIRVPSLNAVRTKIALANGLAGASEVEQLALWIPNSGDFVEPLHLSKEVTPILAISQP
ncbi:unnamed protein product [Closterium sp. Naga37s-1]|nr:unnamed protein product [Closterium sp. Naga37s-1]